MKASLIAICLMTVSLWPSHTITLSKRAQKKINKAITKVWKKKEVKQIPLEINFTNKALEEGDYLCFRLSESDTIIGYAMVKRTKACRAEGCSADAPGVYSGAYEYFDFLMLIDKEFDVKRVDVVNYQAQYGYEICNKRWLKQFRGFNGKALKYGKDIQAISGATISANAITDDVQILYEAFVSEIEKKQVLRE